MPGQGIPSGLILVVGTGADTGLEVGSAGLIGEGGAADMETKRVRSAERKGRRIVVFLVDFSVW